MLKFATVLSITALTAGSALAGDGSSGYNCGAYNSAKASVTTLETAEGSYSLPATTTTVEAAETPIFIDTEASFETVQVIDNDTTLTDGVILQLQ